MGGEDSSMSLMTRSFPHLPSVHCPPIASTLSQSLSHHLDVLATDPENHKWGDGQGWGNTEPPKSLAEVSFFQCLGIFNFI